MIRCGHERCHTHLERDGTGGRETTDKLLPLVYEELRLLAAQKLSHESPGQTLQATALVHEAYLRLVGEQNHNWTGHAHFFRAAAEAMRRILIDNARRRKSEKRGGNRREWTLSKASPEGREPAGPMTCLPWMRPWPNPPKKIQPRRKWSSFVTSRV